MSFRSHPAIFSPHRFEAIVVDDGSLPPLATVVQDFSGSLKTQYIRVNRCGPATARNHGARAAKGLYVAFTDHDCLPDPDWLSTLHEDFGRNPDCMFGGPKKNGLPDNPYSSAHQIASDYAEQWFRDLAVPGYFMTNNLALPRETFLGIGGFNERIPFAHEDREFGARWADHGHVSAWTSRAVVVHRHELTLWTFLRQHFRYGAGAIDFRSARREAGVRFEGLRFHFGLISEPFAHQSRRKLLQASLLLAAQSVYAAGVLAGAIRHRLKSK